MRYPMTSLRPWHSWPRGTQVTSRAMSSTSMAVLHRPACYSTQPTNDECGLPFLEGVCLWHKADVPGPVPMSAFRRIVLQNCFWITEDEFSGLRARRAHNRVG